MTTQRHRGILGSSFLAGLLLAAALLASGAWEPVAEPVLLDQPPRGEVPPLDPNPPVSFRSRDSSEGAFDEGRVSAAASSPTAPPPRERPGPPPEPGGPAILPEHAPEAAFRQRRASSGGAIVLVAHFAPDGDSEGVRTGGGDGSTATAPSTEGTRADPDTVNWVPHQGQPAAYSPPRGPLAELRNRLESRPRPLRLALAPLWQDPESTARPSRAPGQTPGVGNAAWPVPAPLIESLEAISRTGNPAEDDAARWAIGTADRLEAVLRTEGPRDPRAAPALRALADSGQDGLVLADLRTDPATSVGLRRTALAVARRVAVWRATATLLQEPSDAAVAAQDRALAEYLAIGLLDLLERFEREPSAVDADLIARATNDMRSLPLFGGLALTREIDLHYRSANVRLTARQEFLDRLLPEPVVETGPVNEMILGRRVRGTRTVTRATGVRLSPDPESVHLVLEVRGAIDSRTLTSAGPVEVQSRASSTFQVQKAVRLSATGLEVGDAQAAAENRSRRDSLSTSFDAVPIMRSVVRSIARSQHADSVPEANREVLNRITERARKQVEAESTPRLATLEASVRERLWGPLVSLGLEPTPLGLETSEEAVSIRLRLAGANQIAAHTPRPSPPAEALLAMQAHESSINNAIAGLGIGGQRLSLAELGERIAGRLGLTLEEAMADDVFVTFAASEPARIQAADGLVRIQLAIECLDSPRRTWHDIVAKVAYRPVVEGMQVFLEREGPVQLSGAGQRGRLELALRAIFSAVFPKERPIAILPDRIVENRRMDGLRAVQAEADDGWLAIAIGAPAGTAADATAAGGRAGPALRGGAETGSMPPAGSSRDLPRRRAEILSRVRRF